MSPARGVFRPTIYPQAINRQAVIPYGLTVEEVVAAMNDVYDLLFAVNEALVSKGYERIEEIMLGNSYSGLISELTVKALAKHSRTLTRNLKIGGHPDLIPVDLYPGNAVLHGDEGIEVKTSLQAGGWQGHNPERAWIMVFQYAVDVETEPMTERMPFQFVRVMLARLDQNDWSFSGRTGTSRRTPTASIRKSGTDKLDTNPLYTIPGYSRRRMISRIPKEVEAIEERADLI